jgi:hypothetical protein
MENENFDGEELMFDPLTGEPIKKEQEPVETAEQPQAASEASEEPTGFDPLTGEPIYGGAQASTEQVSQEPTGFDPMTGEPIYSVEQANTEQASQEPTGFDPMTGEPLYGDTNTKEKKKFDFKNGNLPKILGGIVAAVVVVAIIATVIVKAATPTYMKIIAATIKTFDEKPNFVEEAMSAYDIVKDKKFTAGMTVDVFDNTISAEAVLAGQKYQLSLAADGDDVDDLSVLVRLDSSALSVYAPKLTKSVIQYDFNKSASGYIADEIDEDDLKMINKVLKGMVGTGDGSALKSDLYKALKNSLKELEFEKLDSDEYEVDGKDVSCKGYRVKITKSFVKTLLNEIKEVMSDRSYSDTLAEAMGFDSFSELISELKNEVDYMDTVKVSFYIYKNKLAAVSVAMDGDTFEVDFKGGDYRIQNVDVNAKIANYGRINILKWEGSQTKNKEEFTLSIMGDYDNLKGTIEYNKKTGAIEINFGRSVFVFDGKINSSSSKVELSVDSISIDGDSFSPDSLTLYLSDKTKLTNLDSNKTFDVNKADMSDWLELGEDIIDGLDDVGLGENSLYQIYRKLDYMW